MTLWFNAYRKGRIQGVCFDKKQVIGHLENEAPKAEIKRSVGEGTAYKRRIILRLTGQRHSSLDFTERMARQKVHSYSYGGGKIVLSEWQGRTRM